MKELEGYQKRNKSKKYAIPKSQSCRSLEKILARNDVLNEWLARGRRAEAILVEPCISLLLSTIGLLYRHSSRYSDTVTYKKLCLYCLLPKRLDTTGILHD
jgi:hypothetical protein